MGFCLLFLFGRRGVAFHALHDAGKAVFGDFAKAHAECRINIGETYNEYIAEQKEGAEKNQDKKQENEDILEQVKDDINRAFARDDRQNNNKYNAPDRAEFGIDTCLITSQAILPVTQLILSCHLISKG